MSLITTDITMDSVRPPSPNLGLSQREAEGRLRQVGPNDPSPRKQGALLLAVVAVGLALPWSPLAGVLGFTALPLPFFLFLGISTITYLLLVEAAKRKFLAVSHHQATSLAEAAT
jgi:hypothetical protein